MKASPEASAGKKKTSSSTEGTIPSPILPCRHHEGHLDTGSPASTSPVSVTGRKAGVRHLITKGWKRGGELKADDEEKQRVRELLLGSALRRFSLTHPAPLPRPGTLRITLVTCLTSSVRGSNWLGGKMPKRSFFVEAELGAARAKSEAASPTKGSREISWKDGQERVLRLYYPGEQNYARGADPVLSAMSATISGLSRKRTIVRLRLMETSAHSEATSAVSETVVELDRLLQAEPGHVWALPLMTSDFEDAGVLQLLTSFSRVKPHRMSQHDSFSEAAENLAAEAASLLVRSDPPAVAESDAPTAHLLPVLMLPSAAAAIASVAASLSTKNGLDTVDEAGSRYTWPELRSSDDSPLPLRRYASMGPLNSKQEQKVANSEQLASLREGWRMWRVAHRSQLKPSHRADIVQDIGERFVNSNNQSTRSDLLSPLARSERSMSILALGDQNFTLDDDQRGMVDKISARLSAMSEIEQASFTRRVVASNSGFNIVDPRPVGYAKGKTCLLTGSTSGVGRALAARLVSFGVSRLILLVHDVSQGRELAKTLSSHSKIRIEIDVVACDLCSMKATAQACDVVRSFLDSKPLDLIVLCAASVFRERLITNEGLERTFACNYLSNFLIVHSLFDLIETSPGARVVVAGCATFAHLSSTVDLDSLQAEAPSSLGPLGLAQYSHTKLMLECFVAELARRLQDKGSSTAANVFHPGAISSKLTNGTLEQFSPLVAKLASVAMAFSPGTLVRTPEQGATLGAFLLNDIDVAGVSGCVFDSGFTGPVNDFNPHPFSGAAMDEELRKRLWSQSGRILNHALGDGRVAMWWSQFAPRRAHAMASGQGSGLLSGGRGELR